jgi:hypothetical protein
MACKLKIANKKQQTFKKKASPWSACYCVFALRNNDALELVGPQSLLILLLLLLLLGGDDL